MNPNKKLMFSYNPIEVMRKNEISFYVGDLDLTITPDNWPSNLIYNPDLIKTDEIFFEHMQSDSTLAFYIQSAIGRCKSLISRATHEPDVIWEHGSIRVLELEEKCLLPWMIRTRTELAIRPLRESNEI